MKKLIVCLLALLMAASICAAEEAAPLAAETVSEEVAAVEETVTEEAATEEAVTEEAAAEEAPQEPEQPYEGYRLVFGHKEFYGGQKLSVYSGPGKKYYRGANGYAYADTDEEVYAAGIEKGWILVMYGTKGGSVRVGYVKRDDLKYSISGMGIYTLAFDYKDAEITKACVLTDDPGLAARELTQLEAGAKVTYLGRLSKLGNWVYVETVMDGQPVRAFVPEDCIRVTEQ